VTEAVEIGRSLGDGCQHRVKIDPLPAGHFSSGGDDGELRASLVEHSDVESLSAEVNPKIQHGVRPLGAGCDEKPLFIPRRSLSKAFKRE
jgi:hypothetical protein